VNVVRTAQGEANMRAQNDGQPGELTLGCWRNPDGSAGGPSALDGSVVLHEYAHGVSQRLVGGRLKKTALVAPQSLALGEAWSDYFAITIENAFRAAPRYTFAAWASGRPAGVRPAPYDLANAHFGMLGTPPYDEAHGAGSIFAAALIRMHVMLQSMPALANGTEVGWRLVIDSLMRVPANPTFLEARDALLASIPKGGQLSQPVEQVVRGAFAAYGMGRTARCNDCSFHGIADFNP
jgi:extracellular elastinolytic metalloproteinase